MWHTLLVYQTCSQKQGVGWLICLYDHSSCVCCTALLAYRTFLGVIRGSGIETLLLCPLHCFDETGCLMEPWHVSRLPVCLFPLHVKTKAHFDGQRTRTSSPNCHTVMMLRVCYVMKTPISFCSMRLQRKRTLIVFMDLVSLINDVWVSTARALEVPGAKSKYLTWWSNQF